MQLVQRYLARNRINTVVNLAGFITEYRPVYSRQIKVYKGIANTLEFRMLNSDQKPVNVANYTPKFQAFDENKKLIIDKVGTVLDDGSSATRGLFTIEITESDMLDIKQQYLSYSVHLVDDTTGVPVITYSNSAFENNGTILISAEAFPGPSEAFTVSSFTQDGTNYVSNVITAEPGINGNTALHTAVVYTNSYVGTLEIQCTLDNQLDGSPSWVTVKTITFDGTETAPVPINYYGVYSYTRFVASTSTADKITKILVRN